MFRLFTPQFTRQVRTLSSPFGSRSFSGAHSSVKTSSGSVSKVTNYFRTQPAETIYEDAVILFTLTGGISGFSLGVYDTLQKRDGLFHNFGVIGGATILGAGAGAIGGMLSPILIPCLATAGIVELLQK